MAAVAFFAPVDRFRNMVITDGGSISSDNANFTTDGAGNVSAKIVTMTRLSSDAAGITSDGAGNLTINGNAKFGQLQMSQATGTVQTLASTNTINIPAGVSSVRVTTAAAVTGIIIPAATGSPGAILNVIHEGAAANTITFAAAGTSNVADGTSDVITGPSAATFIWDNNTSLWYRTH